MKIVLGIVVTVIVFAFAANYLATSVIAPMLAALGR
jgi:hypothetical protein